MAATPAPSPSPALAPGPWTLGPPWAFSEGEQLVQEIVQHYAGERLADDALQGTRRQWILRALRALEAHFSGLRRADGVQLMRCGAEISALKASLSETNETLALERQARKETEAELARTREALRAQEELSTSLQQHNSTLQRTKQALQADLAAANDAIRRCHVELARQFERAEERGRQLEMWKAREGSARREVAAVSAERDTAHAAQLSLQKNLLRERDYQMSNEAGYVLQSIVQLAPSTVTVSAIGNAGSKTPAEAWAPLMARR